MPRCWRRGAEGSRQTALVRTAHHGRLVLLRLGIVSAARTTRLARLPITSIVLFVASRAFMP